MSLGKKLIGDRKKILKEWYQEVLGSFPKQSHALISSNTDRFANPIGFTLNDAIAEIFSALVGDKSLDEIAPALERIIKLRAIQGGRESAQLGFLLALKRIVRERCGAYSSGFSEVGALLEIEDRMDEILLRAYEIYVRSRELILELQVNEIKNKTHMMRRLSGEA